MMYQQAQDHILGSGPATIVTKFNIDILMCTILPGQKRIILKQLSISVSMKIVFDILKNQ